MSSLRLQIAAGTLVGALAIVALVTPAHGEVIELVDKTKMSGKIVHYYDGVYSVETNNQTVKLPREKIRSITFQLPPARPEFATPEKTFDRWRKAMTDGAPEKLVDCYALMYQGVLATQMGLGKESDGFKKMQKEVEGTKFVIKGSKVTGSQAVLKVQRSHGDDVETTDVRLVLENGEWKMTQ